MSSANLQQLIPMADEEATAHPILSSHQKEELLRNIFGANANSAKDEGPSLRIINGNFVQKDTYPWYALLINEEGYAICGGSLIAHQFVATAAHCVDLPEDVSPLRYVAVGVLCFNEENDNCGQEGMEFHYIPDSNKMWVDSWDPRTINDDFALIKLDRRSSIKPVKIDDGTYSESYTSGKDNLWSPGKFHAYFLVGHE